MTDKKKRQMQRDPAEHSELDPPKDHTKEPRDIENVADEIPGVHVINKQDIGRHFTAGDETGGGNACDNEPETQEPGHLRDRRRGKPAGRAGKPENEN